MHNTVATRLSAALPPEISVSTPIFEHIELSDATAPSLASHPGAYASLVWYTGEAMLICDNKRPGSADTSVALMVKMEVGKRRTNQDFIANALYRALAWLENADRNRKARFQEGSSPHDVVPSQC
jgi:hypothetical protein